MTNAESEFIDIVLESKQAMDPNLLTRPLLRKFGGNEADIQFKSVRLRVGRRPIILNLRKLYQKSGRKLPDNLEVFGSYEIWVLTHSVGIVQEGGYQYIQQLGFQVKFEERPIVTNLELLPQTEFVRVLEMGLGAEVDMDLNGRATLPEAGVLKDLIEHLPFDGKITASTDAKLVGRISLKVKTPIIQTIGWGDHQCEWLFRRKDQPLLGDQLMIQVLLAPRYTPALRFTVSAYAVISDISSVWLVPVKVPSDPIPFECSLEDDEVSV